MPFLDEKYVTIASKRKYWNAGITLKKITWHLPFVLRTYHIHTSLCSFGCDVLPSPHDCISTFTLLPVSSSTPYVYRKKMLTLSFQPFLINPFSKLMFGLTVFPKIYIISCYFGVYNPSPCSASRELMSVLFIFPIMNSVFLH